uniref:Uncharacterized protein n=1 Tax=Medicago truncatula TaxID=3880 RepID=Q2HSR7_MEDTR|nr:hypothetical protein MtrDRAFT_AC151000g15v2 [Medicago truncatula]
MYPQSLLEYLYHINRVATGHKLFSGTKEKDIKPYWKGKGLYIPLQTSNAASQVILMKQKACLKHRHYLNNHKSKHHIE